MRTDELCKAFANGETDLRCSNMFIERNIIYSYGFHFPLAIRLIVGNEFKFVVNKEKYSKTTSKHKSILMRYINKEDILKECDTGELQSIKDDRISEVKELIIEGLKK